MASKLFQDYQRVPNPFIKLKPIDPEGVVAIGGDLSVELLWHAYSAGVFPWPQSESEMVWFSPLERGVLCFDDLHVSKSLKKTISRLSKTKWKFSVNKVFYEVVDECSSQFRPGQGGTWITDEIKRVYLEFHERGFAHSFEVWQPLESDEYLLVGGLYGVLVEGVFSGESMFHRSDDASKLALMLAIQELKKIGIKWIDTQMVTPILKSFGGKSVARSDYQRMIRDSHDWFNRCDLRVNDERAIIFEPSSFLELHPVE